MKLGDSWTNKPADLKKKRRDEGSSKIVGKVQSKESISSTWMDYHEMGAIKVCKTLLRPK